jgi:hypothetical protein
MSLSPRKRTGTEAGATADPWVAKDQESVEPLAPASQKGAQDFGD